MGAHVTVHCSDGWTLRGVLTGVDQYGVMLTDATTWLPDIWIKNPLPGHTVVPWQKVNDLRLPKREEPA